MEKFIAEVKKRIVLVNRYDKEIAVKDISLLRKDDIYRVSALWITDKMGNVLLTKRASTKKNYNKWGPAVSTIIEEEQTYQTSIVEKAKEELGLYNLSPKVGPKILNRGKYLHFTQWFFITEDYYIYDLKINSEKISEVKWFVKDELLTLLREQPSMFLDGASTWAKFITK